MVYEIKWLIKRRQFMQSALGASAVSLSWACAANRVQSQQQKVLIIGAGIAGLAAAKQLQQYGFQVTVLEGRDRLGGRIHTDRSLGFPVDLGASWIHGITNNPMGNLARQWYIEIKPTDLDHILLYGSNGKLISNEDIDSSYALYVKMRDRAEALAEKSATDLSLAAAMEQIFKEITLSAQQIQLVQWWLNSELIIERGADLTSLSAWWFNEGESFPGADYIFPQGYDQIINELAKNLEIQLSQIVREIHTSNSSVSVITEQGDFTADAAIVTLPLGVLKSGKVKFSPPLPADKQRAIQRLNMGVLNKVLLKFPRQFWPETYHGFGYLSAAKTDFGEFLNWSLYSGKPALMAFTGGSFAREIEQLSATQISDRIMQVLRRSYGQHIPEPENLIITRWSQDPFAFGSYSYIPVGGDSSDRDLLAEPVNQRLFFAGEATSREYPSTVHGAYLSGIRAAQRLL